MSSPTIPKGLRPFALALSAAAALATVPAQAATYAEGGDAGDTVATASNTGLPGATQALSSITGSVLSSLDADLYLIHIANGASFSATATNATQMFDPQLFLLTTTGAPVALNDDAAGGLTTLSSLSGISGLAEGFYILGISQSGFNPVNAANQLLFAAGLPTSIQYPAAGLQPGVLGGFSNDTFFADSGSYEISLTGVDTFLSAAVPEPASALLFGLGAGVVAWRRRRASSER